MKQDATDTRIAKIENEIDVFMGLVILGTSNKDFYISCIHKLYKKIEKINLEKKGDSPPLS